MKLSSLYGQLKKRNLYFRKIAAILWLCLFIPFCIIILLYSINYQKEIKQHVISGYEVDLSTFGEELETLFFENNKKYDFLFSYSQLRKLLNLTEKQRLLLNYESKKQFDNVMTALMNDNFSSTIQIYTDNPNIYMPPYFHSMSELKDLSYQDQVLALEKNITFYGLKDKTYLSCYRRYQLSQESRAFIEINIPTAQITDLFTDMFPQCTLYLTGIQGKTVNLCTWEFDTIPENTIKNSQITKLVNGKNNYIVLVFPKTIYRTQYYWVFFWSSIAIIFFGILIMSIALLIATMLTKKLYQITDILETDTAVSTVSSTDEFDIILQSLNRYSQKLKQQSEEVLRARKEQTDLQLTLLQERISPHFLYNTLASIKWVYKDPSLGKVIDSMVKYYRIVLNRGDNFITLENELTGIHEYLKLQQFAYGKPFRYDVQCQPELLSIKILKNLLQPVIENAFLHGVNLLDKDGLISVDIFHNEKQLIIRIQNNGPLITNEAIANFQAKASKNFDCESTKSKGGYALANIIKRIHLYYGKNYGLFAYNDTITEFKFILPYLNEQIGKECSAYEKGHDC